MDADERARLAMQTHFSRTAFAPGIREAIESLLARTAREAEEAERESCAQLAESLGWALVAEGIRIRGK